MYKKITGKVALLIMLFSLTVFTGCEENYAYKEGDFVLTVSVAETTLFQGEKFKVDIAFENFSDRSHDIDVFFLFTPRIPAWEFIGPVAAEMPQYPSSIFFAEDSSMQRSEYIDVALQQKPGIYELTYWADFYLNYGKPNEQHIAISSNVIALTVILSNLK